MPLSQIAGPCKRHGGRIGDRVAASYDGGMSQSWKITVLAPRPVVESALLAHEEAFDWDPDIVLAGSEIAEERPEDWQLEAWLPRRPTRGDESAVAALFGTDAPTFTVEQLPETDWVTQSQHLVEPIRAGRFHVRTLDYPPCEEPGVRDFVIPASQAFGTGQHETTAGCLRAIDALARTGTVRNPLDVGTGSGILAMAMAKAWPCRVLASDIDPDAVKVAAANTRDNGVGGRIDVVTAIGLHHPVIRERGPYDLITANILARPLVQLAGDLVAALEPGGTLVLSGFLRQQEAGVFGAYRARGMRLLRRFPVGEWVTLVLRKT